MMQRIIGLFAGGATVAAVVAGVALWLGGKDTDPAATPVKTDDPVRVVIEQKPLTEPEDVPRAEFQQPTQSAVEPVRGAVEDNTLSTGAVPETTESGGTNAPEGGVALPVATTQGNQQPVTAATAEAKQQPSNGTTSAQETTLAPQVGLGTAHETDLQSLAATSQGSDGEGLAAKPIAALGATPQVNPARPQVPVVTPQATASSEPSGSEVEPSRTEDPAQPTTKTRATTDNRQDPTQPNVAVQQTPRQDPKLAAITPQPSEPLQGTATENVPELQDGPDTTEPQFDVVRVDRDGQTVIAGRAGPDEQVEVLIDGQVVGKARADASGQFVAVVFANLSDSAQKLELRSIVAPPISKEPVIEGEPDDKSKTAKAPPALSNQAPQISTQISGLSDPSGSESNITAPTIGSVGSGGVQRGTDGATISADSSAESGGISAPVANAIPATGQRFAVSNPVLILPSSSPDAAPTLVQPQRDQLAVLQPVKRDIAGVVLDSITYTDTGDVVLSGRGLAGRLIRIYANGRAQGVVQVTADGSWRWASSIEDPASIKLFRMDEIGSAGEVTSRVETPFEYARLSPQVVRERRVVIQKGDMLWRIAEQFYGDGIRYSNIYGANSELIRDPDLIYPGQEFTIPELVDAN